MAELDIKQVSTPQWLGIGAGGLAFIDSFLPWYSVSFAGQSASGNGWEIGFLGWFSILLLIAAAVIAALPLFGVVVPSGTLIWVGLAGLAFVLILIRWLTYESATDDALAGVPAEGVSAGASFGTIVGLILAAVSAVGAVLALRASKAAPAGPPPAA
jgi:hypothetical protein